MADRCAQRLDEGAEMTATPVAATPGRSRPVGRASVAVLVEARYRSQAQPAGLVAALRRRGIRVTVIDPARRAVDLADPAWCTDHDLVVCRGRSPAVLALLAIAEARGVPCVNSAAAVSGVLNKAHAGAAMAAAGVPVPWTFLGPPAELADLPAARLPLILKPICGDNATGIRIVRERSQLRDLHWPDETALVQHFLDTGGIDLKLYCAAERVWAVRRRSPIDPADGSPVRHNRPTEPVPVTSAMARLAEQCRSVTGLDLFGVDCADGPDGPVVVEVNDFPNYTGVADADAHLADHVLARVRR
jgi:ribosomal protein S6--L-glutamate ligase